MPPRAARAAAVAALAWALVPRAARACGAAYPGGPVMCDYPRAKEWHRASTEPLAPTSRVGASWAYTSTTLLFGGGRRADLTRHTVFGLVEAPLAPRLALEIAAGGVVGGDLAHGPSDDAMGPGFSGSLGVGYRLLDARGARPFVTLTAALSVTHVLTRVTAPGGTTDTPRFTAFDLRAGAIVGETIEGVVTPYLVGRVFGGPAYWRFDGDAVTGTDLHKYQIGTGVSVAVVPRVLDAFAEVVPLGERGVAAGLGATFF